MRFRSLFVMGAALALVLSACGDDADTGPTGTTTTPGTVSPSPTETVQEGDAQVGTQTAVTINAQNDSGITGSATLVQTAPGKTTVTVTVTGAGAGPQPIHIHEGTCEDLTPQPKYPLTDMRDGRSTTEVEVGLQTLLDDEFAINIHKSPSEAQIYVACGNITQA